MERKKYLELCREVAALEGGIERIKKVPEALQVGYSGNRYYPVAYELSYNDDGTVRHTAVIHELGANAVFYVPLDKVEELA